MQCDQKICVMGFKTKKGTLVIKVKNFLVDNVDDDEDC